MHGRLKVKTSAQKEAERKREEQEKLAKYKAARNRVFELRKDASNEELLTITTQLLVANPEANTFWNVRKEFIIDKVALLRKKVAAEIEAVETKQSLDNLFKNELFFTVQCLKKNPKAYAIWLYREFIMKMNEEADWTNELVLCNEFLNVDERNFHCWDYRRVVLKNTPETRSVGSIL